MIKANIISCLKNSNNIKYLYWKLVQVKCFFIINECLNLKIWIDLPDDLNYIEADLLQG